MLGPASLGRRPDEPFPEGVRVDIAADVRRPGPAVLFGGTPPRLLRLSRRGTELVSAFEAGPVRGDASARLARRLTDAGLAVPRPDGVTAPVDVTVVVPVRDRTVELAACLALLGNRQRVVVVDDGSADAETVAAVCRRHCAELMRREAPGGPAAARNTGLRVVTSELVAFVDSDCSPRPGWIESLAAHLVDPLVVGVAPRIVASAPRRGPSLLDLGTRPAPVHPAGAVPYAPAAAVLFRRAALGDGYDERLRYGEDVDLVWRLVEAGWRIRYEPQVEVGHRDPTAVVQRLRRRYLYGTSVGPLERAHPGAIDHLVMGPGPACTVGSLLLGLPGLGACCWAISAALLHRRLRPFVTGWRFALWLSTRRVLHAWIGLGGWCTTFGLPLLGASLLGAGMLGRRTRVVRRASRTVLVLVGSALVADRLGARTGAGRRVLVDGCAGRLAYGVGVLRGCARAGVVAPLLPRVGRRRSRDP